jgi:hypothetical protein
MRTHIAKCAAALQDAIAVRETGTQGAIRTHIYLYEDTYILV